MVNCSEIFLIIFPQTIMCDYNEMTINFFYKAMYLLNFSVQ